MANLTYQIDNIIHTLYDIFYEINYNIYNLDINKIYRNNIIIYLVIFLNITIIYSTYIYSCFKNEKKKKKKNINNNEIIERIIKIEKDVQTTLKILRQIKNLECQ